MMKIPVRKIIVLTCVLAMFVVLVGFVAYAKYLNDNTQPPTPSPDWYAEITEVKKHLSIVITDPNFTNPVRECDFVEMRRQMSDEYFQATIDYEVFQNGKGIHGDIEAFVEIHNDPNQWRYFHVEVTRLSWSELTIYLDGKSIAIFPTVEHDLTPSIGYMTIPVELT